MYQVTYEEFRNAVTFNGYPAPSKQQHHFCVAYAETYGGIATKREAAMFIAQLIHESKGLHEKREEGCPGHLYSVPAEDCPKRTYYGRGYFKLIWSYSYKEASEDLYEDYSLWRNPDWVADNDIISWKTAFWFWKKYVRGKDPGVAQGKFGASTKAIVNGRIEINEGLPQARRRFEIYGRVLKAFGLEGEGDPSGIGTEYIKENTYEGMSFCVLL